jgi:hypothetical protein
MPKLINLVATRSKNGDHTALHRWYNDHVHLLMGFEGLPQAVLYRRLDTSLTHATNSAPEYICLYEFPSPADFLAFETSDARVKARQILADGWGRDGIEMTQRTQYLRLGSRTAGSWAGTGQAEPTVHHFQSLALGAGPGLWPLPEAARWLSDRVHNAMATGPEGTAFSKAVWHRAADATGAGGDALVHIEQAADAPPAFAAKNPPWWQPGSADANPAAFGQAPATVQIRWQGDYQCLTRWER